ncbi:ATP-binding cassette, subfamily B [Sporobacter termitidis DSM 10068]|uniref:ATP-binding cassette, subfamily B n=1 Tax=Sporobacter termitidis DSM 10068 TaxID=1123282 RepID=A0A1M5W4U3_9FIRM|nr:ATP-binding cassette, subfamily B [Sporobacter termitidis DSM 10068]
MGVAFTVLEGLLSSCIYFSLYLLIEMLLNHNVSSSRLTQLTLGLAGIFLIRLITYSIGYTQGQIGGAAVSKQIRLYLGDKFKKIPLFRFTQGQVGQYVNTMTSDVNSYEQILTHKTGNLVKNITLSIMLMGFVCWLYLPAGLILLTVSLLFIPNMWLSFRIVKKYGQAKNTICAEAVSSIVEYVSGIQTFRAYNMSGAKNKATTNAMKDFSNVCYKYEAMGIPVGFAFSIIDWLTVPVVMLVAAKAWMSGGLAGVDYLMICMMPMLLAKLFTSISIDLFSYKNLRISRNNIQKVVDGPEEQGMDKPFAPDSHDITFQNVRFSYVQGETVLNGVDFRAKVHKLTAIVGASGSGKSTILNLIAKYYEPQGGRILIGGRPVENVTAQRVLEQISIVDQDVFLFDDTVRENIRHARPEATNEEIESACRKANCDVFIRKMEKGYDTPIGENGNLLSGGERQRLSIARAILKNSPILLLDEATASLDIENELAVKQAIVNLLDDEKTVIMIAHTLSIIKNADQILVVSGGRISESGTHKELLAKDGKYVAMWSAEQKLSI